MANQKQALVLEGGGYRGCFTAGVLDVLMERNFNPFSDVWGTSAGALNGCNFKAHQIGRQIRVSLAFRDDRRMMSLFSLATTGSIVGNDFLFDEVQNRLDPFDYEAFARSDLRVWATATNLLFGTPEYFEIQNLPADIEYVKASAALPLVTEAVAVGARLLSDGGTADSIPVEIALGLTDEFLPESSSYAPAHKALVILTQPRAYIKKPLTDVTLAPYKKKYHEYPLFMQAFESRPDRYNKQRRVIFDLEEQGRIKVLAPERPLGLAMAEDSGAKLLAAYVQGRQVAQSHFDELVEFFN